MKWRLQWTPEPSAALFEPLLEAPDRIMVVESFGCVPLMSEKDGAGYKGVGWGLESSLVQPIFCTWISCD